MLTTQTHWLIPRTGTETQGFRRSRRGVLEDQPGWAAGQPAAGDRPWRGAVTQNRLSGLDSDRHRGPERELLPRWESLVRATRFPRMHQFCCFTHPHPPLSCDATASVALTSSLFWNCDGITRLFDFFLLLIYIPQFYTANMHSLCNKTPKRSSFF